jgi:hypothetical protein
MIVLKILAAWLLVCVVTALLWGLFVRAGQGGAYGD